MCEIKICVNILWMLEEDRKCRLFSSGARKFSRIIYPGLVGDFTNVLRALYIGLKGGGKAFLKMLHVLKLKYFGDKFFGDKFCNFSFHH